jgi:hypothetical protein
VLEHQFLLSRDNECAPARRTGWTDRATFFKSCQHLPDGWQHITHRLDISFYPEMPLDLPLPLDCVTASTLPLHTQRHSAQDSRSNMSREYASLAR